MIRYRRKTEEPKNADLSAFYSHADILYRFDMKCCKIADFTPLKRYCNISDHAGTVNTLMHKSVINNTLFNRSDSVSVYIINHYAPCTTLMYRSAIYRTSTNRSGRWVWVPGTGQIWDQTFRSAPFCAFCAFLRS